jgi:hypothetical protein
MIHRLGRQPSPIDIRDYKLGTFLPAKYDTSGEKSWEFLSNPLNQKTTNHCVGFAMANWGINLPVQDNFTDDSGHTFYYKCKELDEDPTGENGTNIRSAAKVLKQEGLISTYAFASSVDEISYWLLNKGPVIAGTNWYEGMFSPDENNIIHPTGNIVGGHGYLINEKTKDDFYGIQNSWDNEWGIKGKAYISIKDFSTLFKNGGEAIASVELLTPIVTPSNNEGCLKALLNLFKRT